MAWELCDLIIVKCQTLEHGAPEIMWMLSWH